MTKLTDSQQSCLFALQTFKVCSANDFDRHAFKALVKKGLAVEHQLGRSVTYTLAK